MFVCEICGVQYPPSEEPPVRCLICDEERQYVPETGPAWTTLEAMRASGVYRNAFEQDEEGLVSIVTEPGFGIGQTAYLIEDRGYRLLWDCITYLDDDTVAEVRRLGGIDAIAMSHPHYYSAQAEWAETFGVPLYIHEDDREWVVRPGPHVRFWSGDSCKLSDGLTLHRLGGHFRGGAVLHWSGGAEGAGVLLSGDILQVAADRRWVSFMYSYPNLIPLPAATVARMAEQVRPLPFERLYNAFHRVVRRDADAAVQRSAERYIRALQGELFRT
nr:MBL fold metallo-hydrolase [Cohnella sp. REN36]